MPLFWALFIERPIELSVPFVRPCWGSLKTCMAAVGYAACACSIVFEMEVDTALAQVARYFSKILYGTTLLSSACFPVKVQTGTQSNTKS